MKFEIVGLNSIFIIWTIFYSCNGQSTSTTLNKHNPAIEIGDTVRELASDIMIIFQDKSNSYWFASKKQGVYKYDGKLMTHFTVKDGLCDHEIIGIQEDKFGNLFFDTPSGVSKFDGQKFTTLEVIDFDSTKNEWKLEPDDLWFRMGWDEKGPYRYDGKSLYRLEFPKTGLADEFYAKYPNVPYSPYGIYTIYKDHAGSIWFGTASLGVCRYDGKSISWLYERHLSETPNGGSFGIRSIIEDKEGFFWFCNTRYLFEILPGFSITNGTNYIKYRKEKGIGKTEENKENDFPYFMSVVKDKNGDLWMATYDEGVWCYSNQREDESEHGRELIHYPVNDGTKNITLFSIYKDNQDVLWLGTHDAGPYRFNGKTFERFRPR